MAFHPPLFTGHRCWRPGPLQGCKRRSGSLPTQHEPQLYGRWDNACCRRCTSLQHGYEQTPVWVAVLYIPCLSGRCAGGAYSLSYIKDRDSSPPAVSRHAEGGRPSWVQGQGGRGSGCPQGSQQEQQPEPSGHQGSPPRTGSEWRDRGVPLGPEVSGETGEINKQTGEINNLLEGIFLET